MSNPLCHMTFLPVPKIISKRKVYISYRVLGFQSHVNLAVGHVTKWLLSSFMWQ